MKHIKTISRLAGTSFSVVSLYTLLTIISASAASVKISWTPNDPPSEGYRVFARRSDQVFDFSIPDWEGSETSCTIDDLEDHTEYFLVVQAFDGDLEGEYSAEIHYVPPDIAHQEPTAVDGEDNDLREDNVVGQNADKAFAFDALSDYAYFQEPPLPPVPISSEFSFEAEYNLILNIEDHADPDGNPPAATHWQIYETRSGNCVLDLITDNRRSQLKVTDLLFDEGMTYYWRARFYDSQGMVSEWSETIFFTSDATPDDPGERDRPT